MKKYKKKKKKLNEICNEKDSKFTTYEGFMECLWLKQKLKTTTNSSATINLSGGFLKKATNKITTS